MYKKENNMKIFILFILLCLSMLQADTILLENKKPIQNVVITRETFTQIRYYYEKIGPNSPQTIDRLKTAVIGIDRSEIPMEYQVAEQYYENGSLQEALKSYQREAQQRKWTHQHCLYKIGLCYLEMGNYREANKEFNKLKKSIPDSVYKADIEMNLGICAMNMNRSAQAIRYFNNAIKLYNTIHSWNQVEEASFQLAQSYELSKNYNEAIKIYTNISKNKKLDKDFLQKIVLKLGSCYIKNNNFQDAKKIFIQLLQNQTGEDKETLSVIYVNLGNCYLQEEKIEDALLCFLRVITIYTPTQIDGKEAYNQAIKCFNLLKNENPLYGRRAIELRLEMEQKYP